MTRFQSLPDRLGEVFTREEAHALGVTSRRLRQADVERIGFALYRRASTDRPRVESTAQLNQDASSAKRWRDQHFELILACRGRLPPGSFLIGRSAAVLWGLPVPPGTDQQIEIGRFAPDRGYRRPGFRCRQVNPRFARLVKHLGLPVVDPAHVWASLAKQLTFDDIVALGDAVIRRQRVPGTTRLSRPPHADPAQLAEAALKRGRTGAAILRRALPLLVTGSASAPETHLRLRLQEWGAPTPVLDHDVFDESGKLIGCTELAYPEIRLALEYEGDHHRIETRQWNRDIEKYRRYEQNHWEVLRVTGTLLYRQRSKLQGQLFEALARRGWPA